MNNDCYAVAHFCYYHQWLHYGTGRPQATLSLFRRSPWKKTLSWAPRVSKHALPAAKEPVVKLISHGQCQFESVIPGKRHVKTVPHGGFRVQSSHSLRSNLTFPRVPQRPWPQGPGGASPYSPTLGVHIDFLPFPPGIPALATLSLSPLFPVGSDLATALSS